MPLYKKYSETKSIACFANGAYGGVLVLDIEYGVNDYVIACYDFGAGREKIRRHKIETTLDGERSYFRKDGNRYYLDEMIRL